MPCATIWQRSATPREFQWAADLTRAPDGAAPTFLLAAAKDADGANLDRVQIIKGWLDTNGEVHESIFDVAVSDGRAVVDGKVSEAVGSTVDVDSATYTNSIGDALLAAWWSDPDFDPSLQAFYYARVIEIPTPRWTAYDQVRFGVKDARRSSDGAAGTGLYLTDLVFALKSLSIGKKIVILPAGQEHTSQCTNRSPAIGFKQGNGQFSPESNIVSGQLACPYSQRRH